MNNSTIQIVELPFLNKVELANIYGKGLELIQKNLWKLGEGLGLSNKGIKDPLYFSFQFPSLNKPHSNTNNLQYTKMDQNNARLLPHIYINCQGISL